MRCIGVTGASGLIGSALCRTFADHGWHVVALGRRRSGPDYRHFELAEAPSPSLLDGIDVLIHAAYDAHTSSNLNLAGTRALFSAVAPRVRQIVFISSMAAAHRAASRYGREKYAVERLLEPARDLVVRPGLVIGNGGLFKSMYLSAARFRAAPLFRRGTQPVYVVGVEQLSGAVLNLVENGCHGTFAVANGEPVSMSQIYREIERKTRKKLAFVPLPLNGTLALVSLLERCGIRLPLDSERLSGLKNLRLLTTPPSIPGSSDRLSLTALVDAVEIS